MINENLKVWLSFDASTTEDKCGNSWTANGSPTVSNDNAINGKALQLNGSSYLSLDDGIELGGKSFSIDCWFHMDAATDTNASIFCLFNQKNTTSSIITVARYNKDNALVVGVLGHLGAAPISNLTTGLHHLSAVYNHVINVFSAYLDGSFIYSDFITIPATSFTNLWLGRLNYDSAAYFRGSIDEFKIYDDTILRTPEFTPPTSLEYTVEKLLADGYAPLDFCADVERRVKNTLAVSFTADVERKVRNALTTWRYENAGNANDLILSSTILTDLPESKSVTGTAFYQTTRAKCFDLPTTSEIWLKFDVYFDGSNRWRAYNDGSNGTTGITAQTTGDLSFFSNDNNVQQSTGICKKNQLQTVLLHMISDSSAGIVEAWVDGNFIYRYTGDVNHGEDFADIYLQSDGAGTFFSNVVISNAEIDLGEGWKKFSVDLERKLSNAVEVSFDVERNLCVSTNFFADVVRTLTASCQSVFDVEIRYTVSVQVFVDVLRNIPMKLIFMPTDTSQYFSGGSSSGDSSDDDTEPVVIPSCDVPINDSSQDQVLQQIDVREIQSFEIVLSEQQLTPQITVTYASDSPPIVLTAVSGQYLDYKFDAQIERTHKQGKLTTCYCCHNLDELIYTQLDFTGGEGEGEEEQGDDDTGELTVKRKKGEAAFEHAKYIAKALLNKEGNEAKKPYKYRVRNFTSTLSKSDMGGVTYADYISNVFGWTSRIYTWLINVFFVKDNSNETKLYFIQRGKEENVIDISDSKYTVPVKEAELLRLFWGSSPTTETRIEAEDPEDDDDDEEQGDDDDDEDEEFASGKDTTYGPDCVITTNYSYSSSGLLRKVTIKKIYTTGDKPNSNTTIKHSYDSDGTRTKTTTETTYSGKNPPPDSKTVNSLSYITLSNGEKFLSKESVEYYEDGDLVDFSVTTHSPSRIGQTHSIKVTDDGIAGETSGQNTGDDRITPYRQRQAKTLPADNNDNDKPASWGKTKKTTINGRTDFDTTFPVSDIKTLELITDELKGLNRSIKTTVSLTIYDYPHLINFQDCIKFNGDEYWLVSNTARTTYQIKNEQNLVLVVGGERYDGDWITEG